MRLHDRCQWVLVVAAVSATAVVSAGPVALAAPVAPGQTVHQAMGDQPAFQFSESMLSGLVLVNHGSQSFQTTVSPQPGTTFPGGSTDPLPDVVGTLTNSVYRDPPNGHLSFLYRFDRTSTLQGKEDTRVDLTDFDSFTTDIFFGNGLVFDITRSASGNDISFHHFGGLASVPDEILIRTDAKAFSSNSTLGLHTADVFDVFDPAIGGINNVTLDGAVALSGVSAPTSGAKAIPLPPAAAPTAAMLLALAGFGTFRRRNKEIRDSHLFSAAAYRLEFRRA